MVNPAGGGEGPQEAGGLYQGTCRWMVTAAVISIQRVRVASCGEADTLCPEVGQHQLHGVFGYMQRIMNIRMYGTAFSHKSTKKKT